MSETCTHVPPEMRHLTEGIICHKCKSDGWRKPGKNYPWFQGRTFKAAVAAQVTWPGVG